MPKARNLTGQKFGKLTALAPIRHVRTKNGSRMWACKCDCGITKSVSVQALVTGHTKSCGCGKATRTTGSTELVVRALGAGGRSPKSIPDIIETTKLSWLTVRNALRKLHADKCVYIAQWKNASTPLWVLVDRTHCLYGDVVDAPRPFPMSVSTRVQKHRVQAKMAREAEKGVAVQVEIETGVPPAQNDVPEPAAPAWWEHLKD